MTIREELAAELKDAMLTKDAPRRDVVRQIQSELQIAETEGGAKPSDDLSREVIARYTKKMQKSIEEYRGLGERGEAMADKLAYEVDYLSRWLPTKLDAAATRAIVDEAIAELGVEGDPSAAGRVTGHVMKKHRDEVDGAIVNAQVREALGG